jgi:hypothetical protein
VLATADIAALDRMLVEASDGSVALSARIQRA